MENLELRRVGRACWPLDPGQRLAKRCFGIAESSSLCWAYAVVCSETNQKHLLVRTAIPADSEASTVVTVTEPTQNASGLPNRLSQVLPWSMCDLSEYACDVKDQPTALSCDPDGFAPAVVGFQGGSIVVVDIESGSSDMIGSVVDEGPVSLTRSSTSAAERSGVLVLARSPDGSLLVVVSPIKIMLMTQNWDIVGECGADTVAFEASASWRGDGECFAVMMRSRRGHVKGWIFDRDFDERVPLDLGTLGEPSLGEAGSLGFVLAWQPRPGGALALAGPGPAVTFFERNGLRYLRNDFAVPLGHAGDGEDSVACADLNKPPYLLAWSSDSTLLAVATEGQNSSGIVNVFARSNYAWQLKVSLGIGAQAIDMQWDSETHGVMHVLTASGAVLSYEMTMSFERSVCVGESRALCAVSDGSALNITDFCRAIIPPPLSHLCVPLPFAVKATCSFLNDTTGTAVVGVLSGTDEVAFINLGQTFSTTGNESCAVFGSLRCDGVEVVENGTPLMSCPGEDHRDTICESRSSTYTSRVRMPVMLSERVLACVDVCEEGDVIRIFGGVSGRRGLKEVFRLPIARSIVSGMARGYRYARGTEHGDGMSAKTDFRLLVCTRTGYLICMDGAILMDGNNALRSVSLRETYRIESTACIDVVGLRMCPKRLILSHVSVEHIVFVLDGSGRLEAADVKLRTRHTVSEECTSFAISDAGFLVYTTRSHVLYCVPIVSGVVEDAGETMQGSRTSLADILMHGSSHTVAPCVDGAEAKKLAKYGAIRPIDRGSTIVCALPDDVRLVLQAPRGNLETVAPRRLILERVRRLAREGQYGAAFALSRQQRVDMNVMVDTGPEEFMRRIGDFIAQVGRSSHLCVFLSFLKGPDEKVNAICDATVAAIDKLSAEISTGSGIRTDKYAFVLLTALVQSSPRKIAEALRRVEEIFVSSKEAGDAALDYLFVLVKDEERLYNEALGTYDLRVANMVAKASQLDPADYGPELRSLRGMDVHHRMFAIDCKLERFESALQNLFNCGESERDRCREFAIQYGLFRQAITLYQDDAESLFALRHAYAASLLQAGRPSDAAVVFSANGELLRAAEAFRDALQWQTALHIYRANNKRCSIPAGVSNGQVESTPNWDGAFISFAQSVAEQLSESGRAVDAARVKGSVLGDLDGALDELSNAEEWFEAFEFLAKHDSEHRTCAGPLNAAGEQCCTTTAATQNRRLTTDSVQSKCRQRIEADLVTAFESLCVDLSDSETKLRERIRRLQTIREAKEKMKLALGTPGYNGEGFGIDESDSDAFSASTGVSSMSSVASDITFASFTAASSSRTSLYHSVGRGSSARAQTAARRRVGKASRKRVREGNPREEEALAAAILRLVPNSHVRARVMKTSRALVSCGGSVFVARAATLQKSLGDLLVACDGIPDDLRKQDDIALALEDDSWRLELIHGLAEAQ